MSDKTYKKTFLAEVIVRIDFASSIDSFNLKLPEKFKKEAIKEFQIKEPKDTIEAEIKLNKKGSKIKEEKKSYLWLFHDKNREKTLGITPKYLYIKLTKYNTYEKFKSLFLNYTNILANEVEDIVINRFGLRYINNIEIKDKTSPMDWKKYLNNKLLLIFDVPKQKDLIARAFHLLILKFDDVLLNFQYGMHNPDYPAKIKKKIFVLDYDAHFTGLIEAKDIEKYMDSSHQKIIDFFENCIKEELRKKMG